jgi:hypothetical protein
MRQAGVNCLLRQKGSPVGLFKQMKDMMNKSADSTLTPGVQRASTGAAGSTDPEATGPDFEPIANVSLALYAQISKNLATADYDQTRAVELAAAEGVSADDWAIAVEGWNVRMRSTQAVGKVFSSLYKAS